MSTTPGHQDLWGDLFEIAVKRGALNYLLHRQLVAGDHPQVQAWRRQTVRDLRNHLDAQLSATDPHYLQRAQGWLDHLLVNGHGLGWTCLREILMNPPDRTRAQQPRLEALWCPLTLRDRRPGYAEQEPDRMDSLRAFWDALHLSGPVDPAWLRRGEPARADFLLLLRSDQRRELLCLEFSLNAPQHPDDFSDDQAHLRELERYVRRVENRGVFSRLNAEVTGDSFELGIGLANYLGVFSSQDKPLFKLCQGSAYVSRLAPRLLQDTPGLDALHVQVLALTQAGIEGLAARFGTPDTDPRTRLLKALGDTYRQLHKTPFQDGAALQIELQGAFRRVARALPPALRGELGNYLATAPIGQPLTRTFSETVHNFCNPDQPLSLDTVMGWIDDDDALAAHLGAAPRQAIHSTLQAIGRAENPCLRDVHAAAVRAGLQAARPGALTVLALEGHPGIGKTTAVRDWLQAQTSGFLFVYLSPRVLINSSVLSDLAQRKPLSTVPSAPSGILTLTSNQQLIINAAPHQQKQHPGAAAYQGAVIFAGTTPAFVIPDPARAPRFFSSSAAQELEARHTRAGIHKSLVSANRGEIRNKALPGVFRTLGTAARHALAANPTLNQLALTATVQAYRELDESRSTIAGLSKIFQHKADTASGRRERQAMAARLPTVIVMVDEIAGDSAGAVLTQQISRWLDQEFLTPFNDNGEISPFRLMLVVADASLGHATVLKRYLESAKDTPDRILIASSNGPRPLRLAADKLHLGARRCSALHIMADGFPARAPLTLRYDLSLLPLTRPAASNNQSPLRPYQLIRKATAEQLQQDALRIISDALRDSEGQVLFFAQDRAFLETLAENLASRADPRNGQPFPDTAITTLHSDTPPQERERLALPAIRDHFRVVLMTSSGSRGISFPRATHIIAVVPRFSVETGLMELAQLIYRGRGYYDDPQRPGHRISGDHASRTLTFMVRDFIVNDADTPAEERDRQWVRQALDLLTFLILLRATIHTRLSGDAAMPGQMLSVAPVGCIGNDELHTFLADHLPGFQREMQALIANRTVTDKGRFQSALDRVQRLFRNATYREWNSVMADRAKVTRLSRSLTASAQPLAGEIAEWTLPDNLYCVGPLWLERQDHSTAEELYRFDLSDPAREREAQQLLGQLWRINQDQNLPRKLRAHADALHTLLKHRRQEADDTASGPPDRRYTTAKSVAASRTWIVLPVDYPRFLDGTAATPATPSLGIADAARDDERWWQALYRAVAAVRMPGSVFPALPPYREMPFLVIIVPGDPTDLERALDDRYFMASSELNLLNTLLFADATSRPDGG